MPSAAFSGRHRAIARLASGALITTVALLTAACSGGSSGPSHPDEFDPRISDLVDFVERERGLQFQQPVYVDFLSEDEYQALAREHEELTEQDLVEIESVAGVYRAMGLVSTDFDALEVFEQLLGSGSLGYYDIEKQRIVMGGAGLNANTRVTLVHELTHALQDQHFGIGLLNDEDASDNADAGLRALVEADAERIEDAYIETLGAEEYEEYARLRNELFAASQPVLQELPPIFLEFFSSSHVLGPPMLEILVTRGGEAAVNAAFRAPPSSDEHIISVSRYLAGELADPVEPPALLAGEEFVFDDEFGQLALLLMLGERLGYEEAWRASDGWGGGAFVAFRRGDVDCVRIAISGDTRTDLQETSHAFTRWAATMPDAEVREAGDLALLTSCDPGAGYEGAVSPDSSRTLSVLVARAQVISNTFERGTFADLDATQCIVDAILAALGPDGFVRYYVAGERSGIDSARENAAVVRSLDRCGR